MRKLSFMAVMLVLLIFTAIPTFAQGTIVDVVASTENLSTFSGALQEADPSLLESLNGPGPFTIFAPTDEAFNNLNSYLERNYDMTLADIISDEDMLTQLLQYHVYEGSLNSGQVASFNGSVFPTRLENTGIGVTVNDDGSITLNDIADIVESDIPASNGVIHIIDQVIFPGVLQRAFGEFVAGEESAAVRAANLSPDSSAVDIYVNGELAISNLEFGTVSDYEIVSAGSAEVAVTEAGGSMDDAALTVTANFNAGSASTFAVVGSQEADTLDAAVITDDLSELPADTARVTVFHAIEDVSGVDIFAGDTSIVSDLQFTDSNTLDVPAGSYDLVLRPTEDNSLTLLELPGTEVAADTYYFMAITGLPDAPEAVTTAVDADTAASLRESLAPASSQDATAEGSADEEVEAPSGTIADIIAGSPEFSILLAVVQVSDPTILEAISGPGPLTAFAPSNQAFENLFSTLGVTADDVLAFPDLLTPVLLYHVVQGNLSLSNVTAMDGQSVATLLEDETIQISVVDGNVVLNGLVNIVESDIEASNGTIHVVDNVLLPQVVIEQLQGLGLLP